jgi:hypothetical protein
MFLSIVFEKERKISETNKELVTFVGIYIFRNHFADNKLLPIIAITSEKD